MQTKEFKCSIWSYAADCLWTISLTPARSLRMTLTDRDMREIWLNDWEGRKKNAWSKLLRISLGKKSVLRRERRCKPLKWTKVTMKILKRKMHLTNNLKAEASKPHRAHPKIKQAAKESQKVNKTVKTSTMKKWTRTRTKRITMAVLEICLPSQKCNKNWSWQSMTSVKSTKPLNVKTTIYNEGYTWWTTNRMSTRSNQSKCWMNTST